MKRLLPTHSSTNARPRASSLASPAAALLATAVALAAVLASGAVGAPVAAAAPASPLKFLGSIETPPGVGNGQRIFALDADNRRAYTTFYRNGANFARVYDLEPTIPRLLSEQQLAAPGEINEVTTYRTAVLPSRGLLYSVTDDRAGLGTILTIKPGGTGHAARKPLAELVPGFYPGGMTYSTEDDRLYLVGEMSEITYAATSTATAGNKAAGGPAAVVALDPDDLTVLWVRVVPECRIPLFTFGVGSLIARTSDATEPSVVFACSSGSTTLGSNFPHQPGVTRLSITPNASAAEAAAFDVAFHPISGNFFNGSQHGVAAYDYGSDRLFLQSLSESTPGAWVFDARLDAWVGAITAPNNAASFIGVNQGSGHFYMGGKLGNSYQSLLVADGRSRRPQNGVTAAKEFAPVGVIFADPHTDRVFIYHNQNSPIAVLEDQTPVFASIADRVDYDALTEDLPETPGTFVGFSNDADGFGARATVVGDTASYNGSIGPKVGLAGASLPAASRSTTLARSASVNLQPAGAAAAAEEAALDSSSAHAARTTAEQAEWPYQSTTCLDGGGGVASPPQQTPTGRAAVTCDLSRFEARSEARHAGAAAPQLTVADARHESRVNRTLAAGSTTQAMSSSSGVRVDVPGAGSIEIGAVTAHATASAHGRRGSADASWSRTVSEVTVKDLTGAVTFRSPGCSTHLAHDGEKLVRTGSSESCDAVAEGVRKALQVNIRLFFPTPEVLATPKGAFSAVGQGLRDHAQETTTNDQGTLYAGDATTRRAVPAVQIVHYHDSIERSRNIIQLAAVEATSVFTVNSSADAEPCATGGCIPGGVGAPASIAEPDFDASSAIDSVGVAGAPSIADGPPAAAGGGGGAGVTRPRRAANAAVGFLLARRSVAEGLLMALFVLLVTATAASVARHRQLAAVIGRPQRTA